MALNLIIEPNTPPLSRKEFCTQKKPPAIALDGYVYGGPFFSEKGPHINFNHHEGVDRLATRATCGQVLLAIRQGLFQCLIDDTGEPHGDVYVDDCDEDCCTSWMLLKHSYMAEYAINPILNRLVAIEDLLDATAGAYCFPPEMPIIQELAWVFEPYRYFRLHGGLERRNAKEFKSIITDVEERILRHIMGRGESTTLDTRYERIGGGNNWVMVREIGMHARTGMFADGIRAYASVRERDDGKFSYVIARMSPFIHFPIPKFCKQFNRIEQSPDDPWGGSHICIGSGRMRGSMLTPQFVAQEMNRIIMKKTIG